VIEPRSLETRYYRREDWQSRVGNLRLTRSQWWIFSRVGHRGSTPSALAGEAGPVRERLGVILEDLTKLGLLRTETVTWADFLTALPEAERVRASWEEPARPGGERGAERPPDRGAALRRPETRPLTGPVLAAIRHQAVEERLWGSDEIAVEIPPARQAPPARSPENSAPGSTPPGSSPPAPPALAAPAAADALALGPLIDFVVACRGGELAGQVAVFKAFSRIPLHEIRRAGLTRLSFQQRSLTIADPHLRLLLIRAVEEVLGHPLPPRLTGGPGHPQGSITP